MEVSDVLRKRCSIRKYKEQSPPDSDITKVLDAARWAPSGLNNQPWRYRIVKDRATREGLARFTSSGPVILSAPCVILICLDHNVSYNRDKDLMGIGAFIQNMLLQAWDIGLGTCWLGEILNRKDEVATFMKLPPTLELAAGVTIGYSDEQVLERDRKSLAELEI